MYTIEGRGIYSEGSINIEEERAHIRNAIGVVASPTTKKRGKRKPGYGDVWAVGNRYRYTEPRNSNRQKLASVAIRKGVDPQRYYTVLSHVQRVTAAGM